MPRDSPNAPEDLAGVQDPEELVLCGGLVKVRAFLVHKERVWHPDLLNVLRAHHQLLEAGPALEREAGVAPELAEVQVQREVLREASQHGNTS